MGNAVILTVDGQQSSRKTIRAILAPDGFRVVEAKDAAEALELLNTVTPDAVLLDVNL
jgi:CheY-like chemotaxis protein